MENRVDENINIGVIGSRRRSKHNDFALVKKAVLAIYKEHDTIVSGGCHSGGDAFAEEIAKGMGMSILIHYPNWSKHGKAAGFVRNVLIADDSDVLVACVAEDRKGGTEHTIKNFVKRCYMCNRIKERTEKEAIERGFLILT